jgi:ATP-dependent Clp protease adaptor protein ClpS
MSHRRSQHAARGADIPSDPPPAGRPDPAREREEGVAVRERPATRTPRLYRVLLHNDDYTTMEFVVDVLVRYFQKTATEATRIMLEVHHRGFGVAGRYTRDEAETRIAAVTEAAGAAGFPLRLTLEPD